LARALGKALLRYRPPLHHTHLVGCIA